MRGKRWILSAICLALPSLALVPLASLKQRPEKQDIVPDAPQRIEEQAWKPARQSSFNVDVLVQGAPIEEHYARGTIYVEAREGREYALRIRNPLGIRVAVALSVDGLNTIDGRHSSAADAAKWLIDPYDEVTITGWQMSSSRARKFYFTTEQNSYAGKRGQLANAGVISAAFFRESRPFPRPVTPGRAKNSDRPLDSERTEQTAPEQPDDAAGATSESKSASSTARKDKYAATGIGRAVRNDITWLNVPLENFPAAVVSIRYEYRPELIRLGVIPRPYDYDPMDRRERAKGFTGQEQYCPEP